MTPAVVTPLIRPRVRLKPFRSKVPAVTTNSPVFAPRAEVAAVAFAKRRMVPPLTMVWPV